LEEGLNVFFIFGCLLNVIPVVDKSIVLGPIFRDDIDDVPKTI
jgi:hypothetical protein